VSHNVYNLTPWTKAHPGRKAAIRHMCGRNATTSYVAGHGGAAHSASILHRYLIGSLGRVASPAAAPSTPAPAVTKYTLADVAAHGTPAACWSAVSGSVYDLTAWIPQHPGGQSAIKSMCGVDGTAAFNGMHSSSASAHTALAKFKIGSLG
jgi:cytochrome b involved in lipid metabolism